MTHKDQPPSPEPTFPEPPSLPDPTDPDWWAPKPGEDPNPPSGDPHRRSN